MATSNLDEMEQLKAWLTLVRTPQIGPVTFHKLLEQFGTADAALAALPSLGFKKAVRIPDNANITAEIAATRKAGGGILCLPDPCYPELIRQTDIPPPVISYIGKLDLFSRPSIAIVGARNSSAAGLKMAQTLAADLSASGLVIVSGLARGIDGVAHKASLEKGTIAVLAGGVDQAYPPQHIELYQEIADKGLLVSERAWGYKATARDFPRRNRIIAALSDAVIVIEAAERSGSLITARLAGELGREVMAVPGSPLEARSDGTNKLIRDGATLVRNAEDVLAGLNGISNREPRLFTRETSTPLHLDFTPASFDPPDKTPTSSKDHEAVLAALSVHPVSLTQLAELLGIAAPKIAAIITELELAGTVRSYAGGEVGLNVDQ